MGPEMLRPGPTSYPVPASWSHMDYQLLVSFDRQLDMTQHHLGSLNEGLSLLGRPMCVSVRGCLKLIHAGSLIILCEQRHPLGRSS